jgi:hypothetical protein
MSDLGIIKPVQGAGSTWWDLPFREYSTKLDEKLEAYL